MPPGAFRLFLACLVVIHHSFPLRLGGWAVAMFFVLSGYWIARMWNEKYSRLDMPYMTFVISRWWRLAPLFLAVQTLGYCYALSGPSGQNDVVALPFGWWVTQPLVIGSTQFGRLLPPSWSLDVEMQFYALGPVLVAGLATIAPKLKKNACLGNSISSITASAPSFHLEGFAIVVLTLGWSILLIASRVATEASRLDLHIWLFLAGVLVYANQWSPSLRMQRLSFFGIISLIAVAIATPPIRELVWRTGSVAPSLSPKTVNLFLTILALVGLPFAAATVYRDSSRWDRWFGDLSYPLYLFHWIPRQWYYSQVDWNASFWSNLLLLFVNFATAGLGAVLLLFVIDQPCQRLRNRWLRSASLET